MKKFVLGLCFPFFLPVVVVAFFAACHFADQPVALGRADLLDLSGPAERAGMDLEFLVMAAGAALVVQLLLGRLFIREVLVPLRGPVMAAVCSLIAVMGVTLLMTVGAAFVTGAEARVAIYWVAGGFGVPVFFGALIGWRLLHPRAWVEPSFPQ